MIRPALAIAALALVSFFWFPGHTILLSDTQIYIPILERLVDPALYPHDIMATRPHVRFTLYDDVAIVFRKLTGAGFEPILLVQQLIYRALGIFGLYLIARGAGLTMLPALAVAAMVSLGAVVNGPQVLTVEYEPVPRGFALSFVLLSLGCAAQSWWRSSAALAGVAWAWHPPTATAYCLLLIGVLVWRRSWRPLSYMAAAPGLMAISLIAQPPSHDGLPIFARLEPEIEQIQRMRASYNWIGTWWQRWWPHYLLLTAVTAAAAARIWRDLRPELRVFFAGLPLAGILSVPVSFLLLDRLKWTLIAQYQPGRYLLFLALFAAIAAAIGGLRARKFPESAAFLLVPFALPMGADVTELSGVPLALVVALALLAAVPRLALPATALAFALIPTAGKVVNFPAVHTAELNELAAWARNSTPKEAVFQFADIRRGSEAGIFRARAVRAIYADWKAGGQANFLHDFGPEWARRWQIVERAKPLDVYRRLGVDYVVYTAGKQPAGSKAVFANAKWFVVAC